MKRLLPEKLRSALQRRAAALTELPDEVVRASRHRVRVAATLGAVAYSLLLTLELSGAAGGSAPEHRIDVAHDIAGITLCGLMALLSVVRAIPDRALLGIALAGEVMLCAVISLAVPWAGFIRTQHVNAHTWAVSVIILFALLVPVRPLTSWLVSLGCALTMPVGLAVLSRAGAIETSPADYWASSVAGLIGVGMANVAARTAYRAGRQIAAAQEVGGYQLREAIGRGGGGEVWKGEHLLLARSAAIKLILPEMLRGSQEALDSAIARFRREAQITSDLRSPHTVQLFDFGSTASGSLYYVMELLEGVNLQHFVYQFGAIEPRRAVHWLRQSCHALGEAHERGLIHRDIKPSNLHVCRNGRDVDYIKVLDFGLSKPAAEPKDMSITLTGFTMGTPGYMAPEQIFGMPIGPATDLYALGCVGYWLLAGVMPFEAETQGEILRLHAQAPPPPLSSRAKQPIPPRLEALVMRCLAKEPRDRVQDADRLDAELEGSVEGARWTDADAHAWWAEHLPQGPPRPAPAAAAEDQRASAASGARTMQTP